MTVPIDPFKAIADVTTEVFGSYPTHLDAFLSFYRHRSDAPCASASDSQSWARLYKALKIRDKIGAYYPERVTRLEGQPVLKVYTTFSSHQRSYDKEQLHPI